MTRARVDVLARVERVAHTEERGGFRHQLHEPARSRSGHRTTIEAGLRDDDRANQARRHRVQSRRFGDLALISVAFHGRSPR